MKDGSRTRAGPAAKRPYSGTFAIALTALSFGLGSPAISKPEEGNHFDVFVANQFVWDNNLYRLPSKITDLAGLIAPKASRQDHINTISAGAESQWSFGRQAIGMNLRADKNRFLRNDQLNNTSGNGKLVLDWRAGRHWTGQAGAEFSRSLAGFANTRFFVRDLVDIAEYFGTARLQIASRWALIGGLRQSKVSHSAFSRRADDFQSKSGNLGIEYSTDLNNSFGWDYRYTKGRFPQDATLHMSTFDRDYKEDTARVFTKYTLTGKTSIDASGGYLKRRYANSTVGNFSGNIWRASLHWQPSAKTQFLITGWRELAAYLDAQSNYFVSKGGSVAPTWRATEKVAFSVLASWNDQNFINSNPVRIIFNARHDKVTAQQATLEYVPNRTWSLTLSYRYEQRDSNRAQFKYDDKQVAAALTINF